jgi:hypothetical protein
MVHLFCGRQVELVKRDDAALLILDVECGPGEKVVMNLLRRAAILEDERDRIFAGRRWGLMGQIIGRRGRIRRKSLSLPLIGRRLRSLHIAVIVRWSP